MTPQKFKTGDWVDSNNSLTPFLKKGLVIQSYWHLDGQTGQDPHMRNLVRWPNGVIEDLSELEILPWKNK